MAVEFKKFFWTRLVPALACLKAAAGLAAVAVTLGSAPADPLFPYPLFLFFLLVFGSTAAAGSVPARCSCTAELWFAAMPKGTGLNDSGNGNGVEPAPCATAY